MSFAVGSSPSFVSHQVQVTTGHNANDDVTDVCPVDRVLGWSFMCWATVPLRPECGTVVYVRDCANSPQTSQTVLN